MFSNFIARSVKSCSFDSIFTNPLTSIHQVKRRIFKPVLFTRPFGASLALKAVDMEQVDTSGRLKSLRDLMKEQKLDIYIVPSEDSHQSEYIAPCDARREFICGFTGSAGTAVITLDKAALATDGRYFNQASKQLDTNWTLLKQGLEDVPTWQEWTADESDGGKRVGVDATLITASDAKKLAEKIKKKGDGELVGSTTNLVDLVWGNKRPARPNEKVKVHPLKFSGKESSKKIEDLKQDFEKKKVAGLVISMLDEIAWLFNLRGNDIPYNPVFFSYAVVTPTSATLYIDDTKFEKDVKDHLGPDVQVKPYSEIFDELKALGAAVTASTENPKRKVLLSTKASWALSLAMGGEQNVEDIRSPVADSKAIKNDTELDGMRNCHIRDGAALSEYFSWLEHQLTEKKSTLDEVQAADKLEQIRSRGEHFVGLSFDTISSTGPNAAVIHYSPERGSCARVDPKAIYLCDSGAQYLDGSTDTTRTLHFGEPTQLEKKAYTLVLKGTIALDQATFPKGTNGLQLDILARQALWREGLDYRHGTGHGVGSYLVGWDLSLVD